MPKDEDKKFQFEFHEESQKKLDEEANRLMQESAQEIEKGYAEELNRNILAQQRSAGRIDDKIKDMAIDTDEESFAKKRQIRRMRQEQTSKYTQEPDKIYAQEEPREIQERPKKEVEQYVQPEQTPIEDDTSLIESKKSIKGITKEEEERARRARGERPTDFQTEPVSRAGISRADTREIGKQKPLVKREGAKPQAKQAPTQAPRKGAGQQRKQARSIRKMLKEQAKKRKAESKAEDQEKTQKKGRKGKMGIASFVLWLSIAIVTDVLSIVPYVGVIISWPFALFFGAYKWMTGIKKSVAVTTTALDFLAEGILSTLPANTLDVIITFIASNTLSKLEKK
jgi:hypothetical protein